MPNTVRAATVAARNQALADCTLIACALERYRATNRQYPETLEALLPDFANNLPSDPMTGTTLKYRPTPAGIVLYSVGWNQHDDGGIPSENLETTDWVW